MSRIAKKSIKNNPDSTIIFLEDHWSISIVDIILKCPLEYGFNGATGLKYEALKDFVKWSCPNGYKKEHILKEFIPTILGLGQFYCSQLSANRKK